MCLVRACGRGTCLLKLAGDNSRHSLSESLVRRTHHSTFSNARVCQDGVFYLRGGDLVASAFDDVYAGAPHYTPVGWISFQ